ncbi:MAG: hypothetical protein N838_28915 [Thiohalocapsa sp. PB-PSB1]|jgi:hypothetical protein|nr:MAG: hypothetical protein N838_31795 [Thiohalocapsa sp. PB-PSB1]QQO56788.1 MAG: hypothetical protein N838_28915 [Thiohalocapsa sp. PB-PSB1]
MASSRAGGGLHPCARVYLTIDPESNTVVISREMPAVNNAQILAELAALS